MKQSENNTFRDRFYELIIMAIFVIGFAVPVIIINFFEILSRVNIAEAFGTTSVPGLY